MVWDGVVWDGVVRDGVVRDRRADTAMPSGEYGTYHQSSIAFMYISKTILPATHIIIVCPKVTLSMMSDFLEWKLESYILTSQV